MRIRLLLFLALIFAAPLQAVTCRGDSISNEAAKSGDDTFREGYIQALVDLHFREHCVEVCVDECTAYLSNLPRNICLRRSVIQFVCDFPGISYVVVDNCQECCTPTRPCVSPRRCCCNGIWFPQSTILYPAMIADPRQVRFSGEYRFHDDVFGGRVGVASYGGDLPIYRWLDVGCLHGDLQVGIQAGVWSVFTFGNAECKRATGDNIALMNSDYLVGFPIAYAFGNWAFRFRPYHESSHLGDEFLVSHPNFVRLNPSREAIDFFAAYWITEAIKVYGGVGYNVTSDPSYHVDPWYVEYGGDIHLLGHRNQKHCILIEPFFACYFRNWQDVNWCFDASYALGIETSKLAGTGRRVRLFFYYHDGYSLEGQFSKMRTNYFGWVFSFGY